MKNNKTVYLRYEFSNEKGKLEGGDIFELASAAEASKMAGEIFKVATQDGVAVNVTIGSEVPFMGFLKEVGLNAKHIAAEMVSEEVVADEKGPKKSAKKSGKKSAKKSAAKKPGAKKPAAKKKKK